MSFKCLSKVASPLGVSVVLGLHISLVDSAKALTSQQVTPIYQTSFQEIQGTAPSPPGISSYGYFFEVFNTTPSRYINALGFPIFDDPSAPWSTPYTVYLYSYTGDITVNTSWNKLASVTFDPNDKASYITKDGYYWQEISRNYLTATDDSVDPSQQRGYVLTAVGDFTGSDLPFLFADNTVDPNAKGGTFDPGFSFNGNGYNNSVSPYSADMPFPLDYYDLNTTYGFFNANASFQEVPAPLPLFGAAAAFGWSRRMRRQIKGSVPKIQA